MKTASTRRPPQTEPPQDAAGPRASLLRAEIHRFLSRRFITILVVLALIGYLGVVTLMALTVFSRPTAQDLAEAEQRRNQFIVEQNQQREICLQNPDQRPEGVSEEQFCGPEATAEDIPVENFADGQPFTMATTLPAGAVAMAFLTAALAFLIGATYVGAEWSTRSMVALLFWEPRRLKVIGVKLLVTAAMAAALGLLAQVLWTATAHVLGRTRGTTGPLPPDFWTDVLAQQARAVLLVTLMALLGFALANLIRNTGASLGVGFVYFAIIENVVGAVRPAWQEWLLVPNILALLSNGGHRIFVTPGVGQDEAPVREVVLSNLHGALVIGAITAATVALGVVLFKRRDLH